MAKTTKTEQARTNRVRFMMLDADLSDGNLSELTQAIAAAMGRSAPGNRIVSLPPASGINTISNGHVNGQLDGADPAVEEENEATEALAEEPSRAPKKPAQLRVPKYVSGLFTKDQGEEFKSAFGSVTSHSQRFLVSAHWLKEKLGKPTINIDEVYTCYKTAGWSTDIKDWDVNFRNHATKSNKMKRVAPGEYEITPIGESAVPAPGGTN